MPWDVTGGRADACSRELMRVDAIGIVDDADTGISTSGLSWAD